MWRALGPPSLSRCGGQEAKVGRLQERGAWRDLGRGAVSIGRDLGKSTAVPNSLIGRILTFWRVCAPNPKALYSGIAPGGAQGTMKCWGFNQGLYVCKVYVQPVEFSVSISFSPFSLPLPLSQPLNALLWRRGREEETSAEGVRVKGGQS